MKTIILLVFLLLFSSNLYAQVIGDVSIGTYYDNVNDELIGNHVVFYTNTVTCLFEVRDGTFNQLQLIERVLKVKDSGNETIYSSHNIDVDPSWNRVWGDIYLPKGNYRIKYYSKDGSLLGESFIFFIMN